MKWIPFLKTYFITLIVLLLVDSLLCYMLVFSDFIFIKEGSPPFPAISLKMADAVIWFFLHLIPLLCLWQIDIIQEELTLCIIAMLTQNMLLSYLFTLFIHKRNKQDQLLH